MIERTRDRGCSPAGRSFVMIELLVVVSIFAVITTVIVSVFSCGISVWDTARNFDARRMEALLCIEGLESELRSSFPFYGIDFKCDAMGLRFAGLTMVGDAAGAGRICEIEYRFDESSKAVYRRRRVYPFRSDDDASAERMISGVMRMKLSRRAAGEEGGEKDELPLSVKVSLELGREGDTIRISRTIHLARRAEQEEEQG